MSQSNPSQTYLKLVEDTEGRVADLSQALHPNATDHRSTGMADDPTRPEIEAQVAASEARGSTRLAEALGEMRTGFADVRTGFAELRGEMREGFEKLNGRVGGLETRLDAVEKSTAGIKATVIGTGIAVVALVIAVLTYGQTWFSIGISTRDVIRATVQEMQQAQHPPAVPPPR